MKRIQFRAWDGKEMLSCNPTPVGALNKLDYPAMQLIGPKDKNGNEIFEGDIVRVDSHELPFIVEWRMDCSSFALHEPQTYRWETLSPNLAFRNEVIGNIYGNADLLH